ncbi:hypothetical protein [Corynebacterium sphenisci]|uniref:hypothetical protein n=1 Tax=Corynebacterium sphenisci TaxID=191493 RepID=UPI0026E03EC2|nr:hypothetical protein [Corynebacterium sphenisci]MDO5730765.1 hypothetical protein [Corynebacterium sphenisci]
MHAFTRTIAAGAAAAGLLIAAPGAAGALNVVDEPSSGDARTVRQHDDQPILSPYGTSAVCVEPIQFRDGPTGIGTCWQQRYDGKWVELDSELTWGFVKIYPVWEDPQAMLDALPPEIRDAVADALGL